MTNAFFAAMVVMSFETNVWEYKGALRNSIGQEIYYQQGYYATQVLHEVQWDMIRVQWSTNVLGPKLRTRWATPAGQEVALESFVDVPGLPPYSDATIYPHYSGRASRYAPWTNTTTSKGPPMPKNP